jgi:hypothetical protein
MHRCRRLAGRAGQGGCLQHDIHVFDRSVEPPVELSLPGLNDPLKDDTNCVLDASGAYVGVVQGGSFRVFQVASGEFLILPSDKEFDSRSLFSEAYTPPPGGGPPAPPPSGDRVKPVTSRVRMTHRRFRPGRRATAFRFVLSEPARVRRDRAGGPLRGPAAAGAPERGCEHDPVDRPAEGPQRPSRAVCGRGHCDRSCRKLSLPVLKEFRVIRPEGDRRP